MEVAAAAPPYPSESRLAAAEVGAVCVGQSGGRIRRRLASRPQSLVTVVSAITRARTTLDPPSCRPHPHRTHPSAAGSAHVGCGVAAGSAISSPPTRLSLVQFLHSITYMG
ncbi:hypothetical protein OsI_05855 [Oryza sativa Indica Group]|uniref:Uncharacterized protein n=1 Tax=Oryza sativa subsp. indica TaxID=39946 RepID=B8AHR9_ORYSI|nr:hypothetical protein OsI_05855 [Oryza sativa Indica Group]